MSAWKGAALFVAGTALGGGAAYLALKQHYVKQAEAEIASVSESYRKRVTDLEKILNDIEEGNDPVVGPPPAEGYVEYQEVPKERVVPSDETLRRAYHKIHPEAQQEAESDTVEQLDALLDRYDPKNEVYDMQRNAEPNDPDAPYVISVEGYMQNEELFEQMTLSYYSADKVLTNEADEVVEDVEGTVGYNNLQNFGVESGNDDTVYVRNPKRETEYEILRLDTAYKNVVLGMDTWEDKEPKIPIKKFR